MSPLRSTLLLCLSAFTLAGPAKAGFLTAVKDGSAAGKVLCGKGERLAKSGNTSYCAPAPRCAPGNALKPLSAKVMACVATAKPAPAAPSLPAGACARGERPFRTPGSASAPKGRPYCLAGPTGCGPNRNAVESGWDSKVKVCIDARQAPKPQGCPSPERQVSSPNEGTYCAPGAGNRCGPRRLAKTYVPGPRRSFTRCEDISGADIR